MIKFMKFDSARASFLCVCKQSRVVFLCANSMPLSLLGRARDMRADADQDECHGKIAISARAAHSRPD